MKNIIDRIYHKLISRNKSDRLTKIAADNPTCVFRSGCKVTGTDLGQYVSILEGAKIIHSRIDDYTYIGTFSSINNSIIGKYCCLGPNSLIGLGKHPVKNYVSMYPGFYSYDNEGCARKFRNDTIYDDSVPEIQIGHDVWLGTNVIIPGGINIGNGAIIAAGSVVIKDVEPYTVVGGNPAKIIRKRFSEDEIAKLLDLRWWDWPYEKVKTHVNDFSSIKLLLERHS